MEQDKPTIARLAVDMALLCEGAELWWRSLSPGTRGVFLQALWEIEQEPAPRGAEVNDELAPAE